MAGCLADRRNYFAPVKVMGRLFRGKMLSGLKRRWQSLTFGGPLRSLASRSAFERLLAPLYETDWIVYCHPPFGSTRRVLSYLARYPHRVAISNDRVERFDQGQVSIRYRVSRSYRRFRRLRLSTTEFLSRFVGHVLPRGFVRIRATDYSPTDAGRVAWHNAELLFVRGGQRSGARRPGNSSTSSSLAGTLCSVPDAAKER